MRLKIGYQWVSSCLWVQLGISLMHDIRNIIITPAILKPIADIFGTCVFSALVVQPYWPKAFAIPASASGARML